LNGNLKHVMLYEYENQRFLVCQSFFAEIEELIQNRTIVEDYTMKKTYKIEVDCANCALKMEEATKKVEGVCDATVSFMTQKMKVEFAEGADEQAVMKQVVKACKKVEADCEIFLS